jgi:hypothetical protein
MRNSESVGGVLTFSPAWSIVNIGNRPVLSRDAKALFDFLVVVNQISRFTDILVDDELPEDWLTGEQSNEY